MRSWAGGMPVVVLVYVNKILITSLVEWHSARPLLDEFGKELL